jgi:DNA-binding NtrC family response regulator
LYPAPGEDQFSQELCRRLRSEGVSVHEFMGRGDELPAILLFTDVTPALCELLEGVADVGRAFVLAVAAGPTGLRAVMRGDAWKLLKAGVADVLAGEDPAATAGEIVARLVRWTEINVLLNQAFVHERCAGNSGSWRALLRRVVEAAVHGLVPILLIGESGTGKEVIAGLIHEFDRRPDKRGLVTVDCTTINRDLSGSELFGHVRGAFTGAHTDREGACALADKGTLFLDEVGELPPPLQAELLRVVQERKFKSVGSNVWRTTEFRLIAATHRDLEQDVAAGRFRHDLYHRLAGWRLALPALRDRPEDIPVTCGSCGT